MAPPSPRARPRLPGLDALRAQPTPRRLTVALVAIVVTTLLLLVVLARSVANASGAMQTVGHTVAPQIAADEDIDFALADMDAQAANWLLVGRRALGSTEADAGAAYYRDRDLATRDLITASRTRPDAARGAIGSVLTGLTTYHGYALQAELLADQGDARAALDEYRLATDLMHGTLLPAMASVTSVDLAALDGAYSAQRPAWVAGIVLTVLAGVLLVTLLLAVQRLLLQRMRRILNPGLAAATLATLVLCVAAVGTLAGAAGDLRGAKQDAFDPRVALGSVRATADDAYSDRSRSLLDTFRAPGYQSALDGASRGIERDLRSALAGASLPGSADAGLAVQTALRAFTADRAVIAGTLAAGGHDAAVAEQTSVSHGKAGYDLGLLDTALRRAIGIDQAYFDAYVAQSDARLAAWGWLPPVAAVAVVALAVAGLWPRLREYQGG